MSSLLPEDTLVQANTYIQEIMQELQKRVVGQSWLLRHLIIALLAKGHILLEWVPGLAKTLSIETLSKAVWLSFSRIQFTPDLLPSDLIGTKIFHQPTHEFITKKWPLFTHLLLADEINRAPAKVQSALLEAMSERQVTIGETTYPLEEPFVVMATQNPLDQEGTYSLPEAQLDRFLLKSVVTYPTEEEELLILRQLQGVSLPEVTHVLTKEKICWLQDIVTHIYVGEAIFTYVKNLVFATRYPERFGLEELTSSIERWVSPRGSLALVQCAKVIALMEGRAYVIPEDIKEIAHEVMRHRIILSFEAVAADLTVDQLITQILETIPLVEDAQIV